MDVNIQAGKIQAIQADAIIVNLFEGGEEPGGATRAVDAALDGAILERIAAGDVRGTLGHVEVLYPRGAIPAQRVVVVGLGRREDFGLEAARVASAAAVRHLIRKGIERVATVVHGAGAGGIDIEEAAQATAEGALLGHYDYRADAKRGPHELLVVEIDEDAVSAVRRGVRAARAVAAGTNLARDLVNGPPNVVTPTHLADRARAMIDDDGLRVHVGDRAWMAERKMGALLAVARGAQEEPAFVTLEHGADRSDEAPLVLVGKGITFDSGGLTLKTGTGMITMKSDMGGAAAVLGAMKTLALLDVPRRVVALLPCTENMPGGRAYRPSDVVTAGNGTTIEIISTDAEGRLALADALVHAREYGPSAVIDAATLTGSSVRALGEGIAGALFANDDDLAARLERAGTRTHERVWRLPLYEDYRKKIASDVADLKNSGGAKGGVGTSAVFLQAFTDYPWAHLDIAGVVLSKGSGKGYVPKGATGFGVRLLADAIRHWEA